MIATVFLAVSALTARVSDPGWTCRVSGEPSDGVSTCTVTLSRAAGAATSPKIDIAFRLPVGDVSSLWQPESDFTPLYGASGKTTFCSGFPVRTYLTDADENRLTLAWDEAVREVAFSSRIAHEEAGRFYFQVKLSVFASPEEPISAWKMKLRFDRRRMHWSDAVLDAARWVRRETGAPSVPSPAAAHEPVYSTWYAFNRAFDARALERECAAASALGIKTLITDDGWQTTHGDWDPVKAKIPDMRAHVGRVQALGMKYMLWYAVPFLNADSRHYGRFKGMYLAEGPFWEHRLGMLDPRFPEVRDFIAGQLVSLTRDWNLDGWKIDFIDCFRFYGPNPYDPAGGIDPAVKENYRGRDFKSVSEAAKVLVERVSRELRAIRPDILVEFRQPYTGPLTAGCGNMLRAVDCPGDPSVNRARTAALRLIAGGACVHSDMLKWTPSSDRKDAARSILAVIFTAVQYSMVLGTIPREQRDEIAKWIRFARAHRDALQRGGFRAYRPRAGYPLLEGWSEDERIFAVYDPQAAVPLVSDGKRTYVVNATDAARVLVETPDGVRKLSVRPYDAVEVK